MNNAGSPRRRADLLEAGEESFDRLYAVNLKGPFFLTQLVAKQMLSQAPDAEKARGRIAFRITLRLGLHRLGQPGRLLRGQGAVSAMIENALPTSSSAADGINVYEIRPGVIATDMTSGVKAKYDKLILEQGITPLRRWGQPEDVGRAVRAIAEDRFPFSTGAVFDVDGGFHLHRL